MITVFGEGRGFRVVWLLEEMGLPYQLRPVDLLAGVENDTEFLAVNPAGFIPAIQDGDVTMVESIAIMEYLMARYGPTPLAPHPRDPGFPAYQQFLHLGEAGLAASIYFVVVSRNLAPEAERDNWGARMALELFRNGLAVDAPVPVERFIDPVLGKSVPDSHERDCSGLTNALCLFLQPLHQKRDPIHVANSAETIINRFF